MVSCTFAATMTERVCFKVSAQTPSAKTTTLVTTSSSESEESDDGESSGMEEIAVTRVQKKELLNVFPAF